MNVLSRLVLPTTLVLAAGIGLAGCHSSSTSALSPRPSNGTPAVVTAGPTVTTAPPPAAAGANQGGLPEPKQTDPCAVLTPAVVATLSPALAKLKATKTYDVRPTCSYLTSPDDNIELDYVAGPLSGAFGETVAKCVSFNKFSDDSSTEAGGVESEFKDPALGKSALGTVAPMTDGDPALQDIGWTQGDGCFYFTAALPMPISSTVFDAAALTIAKALG